MKKNNNESIYSLAVIFKKIWYENTRCVYVPCGIVKGYLDKDQTTFVSTKGDKYSHIYNNGNLGYSIRMTDIAIKKICQEDHQGNLNKFTHDLFEELKQYVFYFSERKLDKYIEINMIAENRENHELRKFIDGDLAAVAINKISNDVFIKRLNTTNLIDNIKKKVIGQDAAIEQIVSIMWQNLRSQKKSNILLIGDTGCGKTEIARNLASKLNIPLLIVNCADLTMNGYKGDSVCDILDRLVKMCDNDVDKAERAIIFLDEFDKLASTDDANGIVTTKGVQYELLKLLENGTYYVSQDVFGFSPALEIKTDNIQIICAGAFSDMDEVKKKNNMQIGFKNDASAVIAGNRKTTDRDIVSYGLIPELVGRLTNIIDLNKLTKDDLITILKSPNNDTIAEKKKILELENISLEIKDNTYEAIADAAIKNKTGARGLATVVDSLFTYAMLDISQNKDVYKALVIDKETLENPKCYKLIKKK